VVLHGLLPQERDPTFSDALAMVGKELWAQEERTFFGVAIGNRDGKSPTGICGTANRRGLLRGVNG
jgi:hypothetical protein